MIVISTSAMAERIGLPSTTAAARPVRLETRLPRTNGADAAWGAGRGERRGACHRRSDGHDLPDRTPRNRVPPQHETCPGRPRADLPTGLVRTGKKSGFQPISKSKTWSCGETVRRAELNSATAFRPYCNARATFPARSGANWLARGLVPECARYGTGQSVITRAVGKLPHQGRDSPENSDLQCIATAPNTLGDALSSMKKTPRNCGKRSRPPRRRRDQHCGSHCLQGRLGHIA